MALDRSPETHFFSVRKKSYNELAEMQNPAQLQLVLWLYSVTTLIGFFLHSKKGTFHK
jgi:hypothetical protein